MLFRVGLVTILLGVLFITELDQPASSTPLATRTQKVLLYAVVCAYGLTLLYAILLRHIKRLQIFAAVQVAVDLVGVSLLVLFTGAPDSIFGFAYLLIIVWGSIVLPPRGAVAIAISSLVLFIAVSLLGWMGIALPDDAPAGATQPLRLLLRPLLINGVAMTATAALATRLAIELHRASQRLDSQHISLRDLATLHREVIQSLQSGLISVDLSGRIATFNAAAAEILGVNASEALGRPVAELLPGIEEYLSSADLGAVVARMELTIPGPASQGGEGERILGVTVSRLCNHGGQLVGRLINFQDLTDLRRAEEAARQADRLAVLGRMAATVAHEIRNPLAAICGSIELLAQMMPQQVSPEARDLMQIIVREGDRLDGLITELLSYASPRPLQLSRVDLVAVVEQMLQVFENDRRLGGTRVRLLQADPANAEVDVPRLRQVLWNALRNAAEADPGGLIEVRIVAERELGQVHIVVRDHGPGVPEQSLPHVFEPFFTTKESGSGLGLATVHRIIEEHGGTVTLRNVPDGPGAQLHITLPLCPN
ncbi:MAG: ATP-binding protein [Myxococcales bacterium]|nr:ATP-binding protein [Myxococcota bacterium]MDW8281340.1 ATP-binding protein [Myxococcales bacterium]